MPNDPGAAPSLRWRWHSHPPTLPGARSGAQSILSRCPEQPVSPVEPFLQARAPAGASPARGPASAPASLPGVAEIRSGMPWHPGFLRAPAPSPPADRGWHLLCLLQEKGVKNCTAELPVTSIIPRAGARVPRARSLHRGGLKHRTGAGKMCAEAVGIHFSVCVAGG